MLWVVEIDPNLIQIVPNLYKSYRFYTNRTDSIQIDRILYKSIGFYTNRSDSIDRISHRSPCLRSRRGGGVNGIVAVVVILTGQ